MSDDCKCQCCTFQRQQEAREAMHRATCQTCNPTRKPTATVLATPAGYIEQNRPGAQS